jgi:hypothetical protein
LLLSQIGNTQPVDQGKNDIVEHGQHLGCLAAADGAAIFP